MKISALTVVVCLITAGPAFGLTEEERREQIERVEQMKRTEEVTGATARIWSQVARRIGWYIDYGGTTRFTYTGGDEGDRSYPTQDSQEFSKDYELNVFLNLLDLPKTSKFYTRLRSTYTERKKNSGSTRGNEWTQLEVDAMYYERKYSAGPTRTTFTLGRQFVSVGKGIAYSATADGAQVQTSYNKGSLTMFWMKADRSPDDLDPGDLSPPTRSHTHRDYFGGEFKWSVHPKWSPYLYYVENRDKHAKVIDPKSSATQGANLTHRYQPTFVGMGANGSITPKLSYFGEFVRVYGTTTSAGDREDTTRVRAKAYDVGLKYRITSPYQPTLGIEWAYGSGDADRQSTVNSTLFGNQAGDDKAFRPAGGLGMGYAFAPTLANIRATKVSGSASPFSQAASGLLSTRAFRTVRMTADFYMYKKVEDAGPVSDFDVPSDQFSKRDLGKEINLETIIRPYSDMTLNVRWGMFNPGSAYDVFDATTNRQTRARAVKEYYWRVQWSLDI